MTKCQPRKPAVRAWRWCAVALAAVVVALGAQRADAGLIVNSIAKDTLTELEIEWGWDPETTDISVPTLTNWSVSLTVINAITTHFVVLNVRHLTDPHPGIGEAGGGNLAVKLYSFAATDFGLVIDDAFSAAHPPEHNDKYTFKFDRSMAPALTTIKLTGAHVVPEPCSLVLAGLGALGLVGCTWRRRRA